MSDIYCVMGRLPMGPNYGAVVRVDSDTGAITPEYAIMHDEGVANIVTRNGKVYVPGIDSRVWGNGNLYIRNLDGTWSRKNTIPSCAHCLGIYVDDDGTIYVAVSGFVGDDDPGYTSRGYVYKSIDDGDTWSQVGGKLGWYVADVIMYNGELYCSMADTGIERLMVYRDGDWQAIAGADVGTPRMVVYDNKLVGVTRGGGSLFAVSAGLVETVNLGAILSEQWNTLAVRDGWLYVLTTSAIIKANLIAYSFYTTIANALSIRALSDGLAVSTVGTQAQLFKVVLN